MPALSFLIVILKLLVLVHNLSEAILISPSSWAPLCIPSGFNEDSPSTAT